MEIQEMEENKNQVHLGDNVSNEVKSVVNDELREILKDLVRVFSKKIKDKIPELPNQLETKIKELADRSEVLDEIAVEWSKELYEKGLVPKGYSGLPDELLIANFHQDGYLEGLYAGYVIAMMSLVNNNAEENLIVSVRDDIRSNLFGHHYDNRNEFYDKYKEESYAWVEKLKSPKAE